MERTWQKVAVAAVGVVVLGGMMPFWPDPARFAAFGVAAGLAVAALVLRRRVRRDPTLRTDHGGVDDAAFDASTGRGLAVLPPDARHQG